MRAARAYQRARSRKHAGLGFRMLGAGPFAFALALAA